MTKITAISTRGKSKGTLLEPHLYEGKYYKVAKGGNTQDCHRKVYRYEELSLWVDRGWSIRMSGKGVSPSIITAKSLHVR